MKWKHLWKSLGYISGIVGFIAALATIYDVLSNSAPTIVQDISSVTRNILSSIWMYAVSFLANPFAWLLLVLFFWLLWQKLRKPKPKVRRITKPSRYIKLPHKKLNFIYDGDYSSISDVICGVCNAELKPGTGVIFDDGKHHMRCYQGHFVATSLSKDENVKRLEAKEARDAEFTRQREMKEAEHFNPALPDIIAKSESSENLTQEEQDMLQEYRNSIPQYLPVYMGDRQTKIDQRIIDMLEDEVIAKLKRDKMSKLPIAQLSDSD